MKKLLLLVQFVFLTVSISYGQFVSCEIKSVCENDLLQSEELIAFFQKSTNSNAQDSWHTLYLANEVGKRIDNIALTNVSNNLKQTSKSVDDLADEITEVGGYVKWKVLANSVGNRFFKSIDEFKAAIAKGDNVFYVGKHTDITPRPTGVQSHHGVNSVWMKAKFSNYSANKAPSVYMLNNPNHNATRGIFNTWAKEMRIKQGLTKVDYSKITKDDILDLAKKQFDAADTPQLVRDEYYKLWDDYLKTLTPK